MAQDQSTFNAAAYLAANPDVAAAGIDPWYHYQTYGINEGRQASFDYVPQNESTFNAQAYLAANPDVAAAIGQPNVGSAWEHYQNYGKNEGRQATFAAPVEAPIDYKQLAGDLESQIYGNYGMNQNYDALYGQLQDIKSKDPAAYYENQLKFLGQQVGWQIGQNRNDRTGPVYDQIKSLIPEAQAAGLSAEKINSLVGESINQANAQNQQRIANEASQGNFWTENLIGAAKVGALALGAGGLDAALNAGATGINGALESYLGTTGGAYVPAEGFSATLPGFADAAGGYLSSELAGPTYQELGYTGLEAGQMGPTYAELGYTGLNNAEAIAAADAASAAAKGMTLSEALSAANKARTGLGLASSIAKAVGGGNSGAQGGVNTQQLASLLRPTNTFNPINLGQIQPKNPFTFNTQGQTQASEGMYDVSGMANALRNR